MRFYSNNHSLNFLAVPPLDGNEFFSNSSPYGYCLFWILLANVLSVYLYTLKVIFLSYVFLLHTVSESSDFINTF